MTYRIEIEKTASRTLESLSSQLQRRIASQLLGLAVNPYQGARKVEGVDGYRIRVGNYRVLYTIDEDNKTVLVWRIGHRRDVYR